MEETSDNREKERGNSSVREGTHEDTPRTTQEASSTATAVEGAQKDGHDEAPKRSATSELASMLSHEGTYEDPTQLGLEDDDEPDRPLNWSVIAPAGIAVIAVVCWGLFAPDHFANFATTTLEWIVDKFGWAFVLFTTVFVGFALAIGFSKFGSIKLGRDDEQPEFSTPSWIAMMFAAGMGIGLMFYGTTEPLTFFRDGVPGHDSGNMRQAFASTLFHWTLHPWAIYSIVGLSIAYITFRRGKKQLLSAAFIPLIGEKAAEGWLGKLIDILAIFATVFGTACSLGLGALQIGAGLQKSGIISEPNAKITLIVVLVLTACFLVSAMSGVGKGIQYLSNANMVLAGLLALFVFVAGPTVAILNTIPLALGSYLDSFFEMAARTANTAGGDAAEWLSGWTIFYWAWWISWSPFVGMFLARISRGRTVREFIIGVMAVPAAVSLVWFCIFGGTAIKLEQIGRSIWGDGAAESQLFDLLHSFPLGNIVGIVAMVLLATFFITSADSASTVMGSMSQNGQSDANRWVTATWGVLTAAIGLVLLISGGDDALNNLQNVTIIAASPFLLVLIGLMVAIVKGLANDPNYLDIKSQRKFAMRLARERRLHRENQRRLHRAQRNPLMPKVRGTKTVINEEPRRYSS